MNQRTTKSRVPLVIIAILFLFGVNYISLSIGLVDDILASIFRPMMLDRLDTAMETNPPDVHYLLKVIMGSDWYLAARAANHVVELNRDGKLKTDEAQASIDTLMGALSSSGHWWRLGWDLEEPEFEQFRGAGIEAVASFGLLALPSIEDAMTSKSSEARDAACLILVSMVEHTTIDPNVVTTDPIRQRIADLTNDRDYQVRTACRYLGEAVRE